LPKTETEIFNGVKARTILFTNSLKSMGQVGLEFAKLYQESTNIQLYRSENDVKNKFYGSLRKTIRKMNQIGKV
jgi:hypothetical protein